MKKKSKMMIILMKTNLIETIDINMKLQNSMKNQN